MNAVWESIFLLGIGLLGINIAVYVLAVAYLGIALKSSSKEMDKAVNGKQISSAMSTLNSITATGVVFCPGLAYLFAIGLSIWGRYVAEMGQKTNWIILGLVVVALVFGIIKLYLAIRAIEKYTIDDLRETNRRIR